MRVLFPLVLFGVLITCSTPQAKLDDKNTSNTSKLQQDKLRSYADYSWLKNQKIPTPKELGNNELDIRSVDCSNKNLSKYNPQKISFDYGTVFPKDNSKLPKNFDINKILEIHKNPGLGIHKLHKMGIDGKGVSMAIIDQALSPHQEYNDNLVYYEEFFSDFHKSPYGNMHGSAVSSIAVGKKVGIAPKAKLYYFAVDLVDQLPPQDRGVSYEEQKQMVTSKYYAQALQKILDINKSLADNQKIVVVSVSAHPSELSRDPQLWNEVLDRAKKEGVFVTTTGINKEYGLFDNGVDRNVFLDPDNPNSYFQTYWQTTSNPKVDPYWIAGYNIGIQKKTLCFPMDHRTTAAPNGEDHYVHYANGGFSWMKPFEAGMYVLAKQVKKDITPQEFFNIGLKTGKYSKKTRCVLINPVALINALKKDKVGKKEKNKNI